MRVEDIPRDIEMNGRVAFAVAHGFGVFTFLANRYLAKHGIGRIREDATLELSADDWVPLVNFVEAIFEIQNQIGDDRLFEIGRRLADHAVLAPGIRDIHGVLASLDVSYHMNHRRNGQLLYDTATRKSLPGIGGYAVEEIGLRKARVTCDTAFPCDYALGSITGQIQRIDPKGHVTHEEGAACKKQGAQTCAYIVDW